MDFSTIQNRVSDNLDYSGLSTKIKAWINDYRQTLAVMPDIRWPQLWTDSTTTVSSGSSSYTLPSDFIDLDFIMLGNKKLAAMTDRDYALQGLDDEDDTLTADEPDFYVIKGKTIKLYPPPDATYTLRLYYYAMPSDLSDDSDTDHWTIFYPNLIIHGATVLGALYLDDKEKVRVHQAFADRELATAIKSEKDKKKSDVTPVMRTYKDYGLTQFKNKFRVNPN